MVDRKRSNILPKEGERNILITSALPYVNNVPHLGNIIGSVLSADVFARYSRARGVNTLFVCGTDEYGTATETKAIEEGTTPQELCNKYHALHKETYDWFNIDFDIFGRTPTRQQTEIAQDIFTKLNENGYLKEETTKQPYCEKHEAYLADRYVEGECPLCGYLDARGDQCDKCGKLLDPFDLKNPKCKLDGATPIQRDTKHVFLLLDKLQNGIAEWNKKASTEGAWSSNGINITENWLREGLKPRGITRDLKWGTPVPLEGYEKKVLYVWFDACIGYVSITANYTEEWEKWWRNPENVKLYQFMGKDNVPFHTVIFPGSQQGTGDKWTMLHHLSTTEYLNYENGKFSKSRNVGVFGTNAKETGIPPDVWRYYLLSRRPENGDSEFEWKAFIDVNNNELLKNLGNFVNRIVKFVNAKNYNSVMPDYTSKEALAFSESNLSQHIADINKALSQYNTELEAVKLKAGLVTALHISSLGNLLLQHNTLDNKLFEEQRHKCDAVVGLAINLVHLVAAVIEPYMPATSTSILAQLNAEPILIPDHWTPDTIKPEHKIGKAAYLFSQIKAEKEQEWREQYGGAEANKAKAEKAAKAAKKKADKIRHAAEKAAKKEAEEAAKNGVGEGSGSREGNSEQPSVEAVEKDGAQDLTSSKVGIDEVTEGVHQTALQTS